MGTSFPSVLTDPSSKTALIGVPTTRSPSPSPRERASRAAAVRLLLSSWLPGKNLCAFAAEYRFNAVGLAFVRDLRLRLYDRISRRPSRSS
jgi:hypothetical protein